MGRTQDDIRTLEKLGFLTVSGFTELVSSMLIESAGAYSQRLKRISAYVEKHLIKPGNEGLVADILNRAIDLQGDSRWAFALQGLEVTLRCAAFASFTFPQASIELVHLTSRPTMRPPAPPSSFEDDLQELLDKSGLFESIPDNPDEILSEAVIKNAPRTSMSEAISNSAASNGPVWPESIRFAYPRSILPCLIFTHLAQKDGRTPRVAYAGLKTDRELMVVLAKFLDLSIFVDRDVPWVRQDIDPVEVEVSMPPPPFDLDNLSLYEKSEVLSAAVEIPKYLDRADMEVAALQDAFQVETTPHRSIVAVSEAMLSYKSKLRRNTRENLVRSRRLSGVIHAPGGIFAPNRPGATNLILTEALETPGEAPSHAPIIRLMNIGEPIPQGAKRGAERPAAPNWSIMPAEREERSGQSLDIEAGEILKRDFNLKPNQYLAKTFASATVFTAARGKVLLGEHFNVFGHRTKIEDDPVYDKVFSARPLRQGPVMVVQMVRPTDIDRSGVVSSGSGQPTAYDKEFYDEHIYEKALCAGDLLLVVRGDVGRVAVVSEEITERLGPGRALVISQSFVVIRALASKKINIDVLHAILKSSEARNELAKRARAKTSPFLSHLDIARLFIPIPSKGAQDRIKELRKLAMTSERRAVLSSELADRKWDEALLEMMREEIATSKLD